MTGRIGFSSGYYAMRECDALLMLGTNFPYRQFYPQGGCARIAQVDLRPENIGRRTPVDLGIVGDVRAKYITMNGRRRLLGSFSHGSMANAMPQAIGAQAAYPGRQVISLSLRAERNVA
jgi:thiamine pyrophosphate-dependent acetolactate synthase large subunit-like protein